MQGNSATIHQVLQQYWGYNSFRPLQEDIVLSILEGHDTLALLPTGGGKSICFQVPAMAMDGLCVVVSPLIALMKDQVENLVKRDIPAAALYSGMSKRTMESVLSKARHGQLKFLYVSPERLVGQWLQQYLEGVRICLLAVDEAHCISQWGYDFRPEYLRIVEFRERFPETPVLALTASATARVITDIQEKLQFKNTRFFRKSFARENLAYIMLHEDNKHGRMLQVINRIKGSGLVYVKNRKTTLELARYLSGSGISAEAYHGGLPQEQRVSVQDKWIRGDTRVVVCTNAFGMGIDKPDVRFVLHFDLPDAPEAYYQEAGRAGRDGQKSYCTVLYQDADIEQLRKQVDIQYPDLKEVVKIYDALCNYLQIAPGAGAGMSVALDMGDFCKKFNLNILVCFHAVKLLQQNGYIQVNEAFDEPSRLMFLMDKLDLYDFQMRFPRFEPVIKLLLRAYGGIYDHEVKISEADLARKLNVSKKEVEQWLHTLHAQQVLEYTPVSDQPRLIMLTPRVSPGALQLDIALYNERRKLYQEKVEAMVRLVTDKETCRSIILLQYFDETDAQPCGICDICLARKKREQPPEILYQQIKALLTLSPRPMDALVRHFGAAREPEVLDALRLLLDNNHIRYNEQNHLIWQH